MADHDGWSTPVHGSVSVAIEVDDIGSKLPFERKQPVAGSIHVPPGILHPLQFESGFANGEIANLASLDALSRVRQPPHGREQNFHAVLVQRTAQLHRICPYAAQGVGCHQDAHAAYTWSRTDATSAYCSASESNDLLTHSRLNQLTIARPPQSSGG